MHRAQIHPLHFRRQHLCRAYRAARGKLQRLLHKSKMRGWLAEIKRYNNPPRQVRPQLRPADGGVFPTAPRVEPCLSRAVLPDFGHCSAQRDGRIHQRTASFNHGSTHI